MSFKPTPKRWQKNFRRTGLLKRKFGFIVLPVFFFLFPLCFTACSNKPPEILQLSWQLYLVQDDDASPAEVLNAYDEELAVFVLVRDDDGEDDFDFFYLIDDEGELFWELRPDDWERVNLENETWLGSSRINLPPEMSFWGRNFRVILIDKSGQRNEKNFLVSLRRPPSSLLEFPRLRVSENSLVLESGFDENLLKLYDAEGRVLDEFKSADKVFPLSQFSGQVREQAESVVIFAQDPDRGYWLKSRAYSVKD